MSKHRYQTKKINNIDWRKLAERIGSREVVLAIDVAKEDFVAALMCASEELLALIKWQHPQQTPELLAQLEQALAGTHWCAVMEPTGTYGDSLRHQLVMRDVPVYQIGPKRVHDAAEVFDGVPSLHDAKAAWLIGILHWRGVSQPWPAIRDERRALQAQMKQLDWLKQRQRRGLNRLEALLSRHWPEASRLLGLDSVTLLTLIADYGDPAAAAADRTTAHQLMRRIGGPFLSEEKIGQLLDSAEYSLGVPCVEAERELLQWLARDLLDIHQQLLQQERRIHQQVKQDTPTHRMAAVVSATTAAVLSASLGSACDYANPQSYLKGAGLNLKERSSGKLKGQLSVTKRGPSVARQYLYFAALRLIRDDAVAQAWYQRKVERDGGLKSKAIMAVMRKLCKALWHVARGETFDTRRLFNVAPLGLS